LTGHSKIQVLSPPHQRTKPVKLRTVGDILNEMRRLYRGSRSGNVPPEDLTRLMFALDKIRNTLEAAAPMIDSVTGAPVYNEVNLIGIPPNWSVIGLLGDQVHMPNKILPRLRELLPHEAFTKLPDPELDPTLPPTVDSESLHAPPNDADPEPPRVA
jgi:hypothetical protein